MIGVLIYLAGIGTGVWIAGAIYGFALPRVLPAREVGVRIGARP